MLRLRAGIRVQGQARSLQLRMSPSWLVVVVVLCTTLQSWASAGILPHGSVQIENRTMQIGDQLTLTSPSFPLCCMYDFAYLLQCKSDKPCGFNVLFIDVDIPDLSRLEIYAGPSSQSPLLGAAVQEAGVWSRPSLLHTDRSMSIMLKNGRLGFNASLSGVTVQVTAINIEKTKETPANTSGEVCGSAFSLQTWRGGEVDVSPVESPFYPSPDQDCVWMLKKPRDSPDDLYVFVRFTLIEDIKGKLQVKNGSNSDAKDLYSVDSGNGKQVISHKNREFSSTGSLYVHLRKPSETGHLTFVYGLFYHLDKPAYEEIFCWMQGKVTSGFFCARSSWCIPYADRCDGVSQCPNGEDEKGCPDATGERPSNNATATDGAKKETSGLCWAWEKKCPDGSCSVILSGRCPGDCWAWEEKCADGSCVTSAWKQCPGTCRSWEKRCPDGTCVLDSRCLGECEPYERKCSDGVCIDGERYCVDEECPSHIPHKCGDKCYGDEERCNGASFCNDGSDEQLCTIGDWTSFTWLGIPIVIGLFIVVLCVMCSVQKRFTGSNMEGGCQPITSSGSNSYPSAFGPVADFVAVDTYNDDDAGTDSTGCDPKSPTRPSTSQPPAPPSYSEALNAGYDQPLTQPSQLQPESLPPSYEVVLAEDTKASGTTG